ncbi:hypothetical protein [Marinomonas posidonica]|uniref:Uncharacterized protein n=1 Tax=Marinomonas posidonica (strain CECT 7376 / NCIMB 14433 / IVIA-Po-181) TaxID=491952 RepID=F6D0J8_MARPP|nr:hypothetical protein [Marinomonas posidonica]AEF54796.1 hypothetical protein Mar181_1758 [Marinomonas posidonica IVIA-Po-181]
MSKWLIWTTLELATLLLVGCITLLWLSHSLKKKIAAQEETNQLDTSTEIEAHPQGASQEEDQSYKHFAQYLDKQISHAAESIKPNIMEPHQVNTLKIWGTVLKAERAIVLNQVSKNPKPILSRFLSSLLYALSTPKLQTTNPDDLTKNLKSMEEEFYQTSELLISKETLSKNQQRLNEDLRKSIDNAAAKLQRLKVKKNEQQRLHKEAEALKKRILRLEELQSQEADQANVVTMKAKTATKSSEQNRTASYKQIMSLNSLADRQQMVIDQLRNELEHAGHNPSSEQTTEAQKVAVTKLERMSQESQSLIFQLEAELESSDLSIESLRQDIQSKDEKLAEMEKQLSSNNETVIGNLQTLSTNKKAALGSLKEGLSNAIESNSTNNLLEQEKDTQSLERLLQESETCVTLLAQELEMAEQSNNELQTKMEALILNTPDFGANSLPLRQEKERNRKLAQATAQLKDQLATHISEQDYQELRVSYNKKSLEYDRLQLAYSDLEMKYLGTLNK